MKAAIYHGIKNVTVEEIPIPECGPKDVILKTVRAGICGTDIGAYFHGGEEAGIFPIRCSFHKLPAYVLRFFFATRCLLSVVKSLSHGSLCQCQGISLLTYC